MIGAVIHVVWLSSMLLNQAWAAPTDDQGSTDPQTPTTNGLPQVEKIGGCLYYFFTEEKNWDDAQAACKALGTNSNIPTSLAEAGTDKSCDIQELMDAVINKGDGVWFGAKKTAADPQWVWQKDIQTQPLSTLSLSSNLWRSDEPMTGAGMCLKANIYGVAGQTEKRVYFKNEPCTNPHHFVCQAF